MDARRIGGWLLLLLLCAGCRNPFSVATNSRVTLSQLPLKATGPVVPMPVTPPAPVPRKIALIDVDGFLVNANLVGIGSAGENPVAAFHEKLQQVAEDPCYGAVVVRINSPGGGVTASDVMRHELEAFKARTGLPVVACLLDVGTGGAYYLATAGDYIVAHPTTITGGMGVILNLYNLQEVMLQFNVIGTPVKAGQNIDMGTPLSPLNDESRAILQRFADGFHQRYQDVVNQARPTHPPRPDEVFDGRILTAQEALHYGLLDHVGYLDDAIRVARQLANCPAAPVVMLHRCSDPAHSVYDVTPVGARGTPLLPHIPGLMRSELPTFLYLWQPEPMMEK